jgi:hypothetical protein
MAAELKTLGATHITQHGLDIGGVPGMEASWQLNSASAGTLYISQLPVLPKPNDACIVTLTVAAGESGGSILRTAAATAQFA